MSEKKTITDPVANYKRSEPFASTKEADAALTAFSADLRDLAMKHRIANVLCVYMGSTIEGTFMASAFTGDVMNAEPMAAYAYGRERCEREKRIIELLGNKP